MPDIDRQINILEMRLTRKPSVKTAAALALRCWLSYRIAALNAPEAGAEAPPEARRTNDPSDPRAYLHRASHTAVTALRRNESDIRALALSAFIAIEAERFDNANELLDAAMNFKSYLKTNEPFWWAVFNFLCASLEIRQKRLRSARKYILALEESAKALNDPRGPLMTGILRLELGELAQAGAELEHSFNQGCRSVFLFFALYRFYRMPNMDNEYERGPLLTVLLWAAAHRADVESVLLQYPRGLHAAITQNPAAVEQIYENRPSPAVLRVLCAGRMLARDYGPEAYAYYKDAERKQVNISGLYTVLVRAAYKNGAERVNRYAMSEFLRSETPPDGAAALAGFKGDDTEFGVYVCHLLLTDPALADFLSAYKPAILACAARCLENGDTGRMVNSLYHFFWTESRGNSENINKTYAEQAENLLLEDLTRFEVKAPAAARYIYMTERQRRGMAVYELTPSGGAASAVIRAVNERFTPTCLGAGRRTILEEPVTIRRMVARADPALYRYFFRRGERSFELLAELSEYYLSRLESGESETPDEPRLIDEALPVFEAMLAEKEISKPFKMRIHVALGGLCYKAGDFEKALDFYGTVDENYLDDSYIERMLAIFLNTREYARAAGLIMRKGRFISGSALFNALKTLSAPEHAEHHAKLADAAYDLLLRSWFDRDILTLTLKYYNGGQSEWETLSRALAAQGVTEPMLDEIILRNSIWMHQLDEDAEKTFARFAAGNMSEPPLAEFIDYVTYEILINGFRPNYESLTLLEAACETDGDNRLLMYALCHVYLTHNLTTFNSDKILAAAARAQEDEGLLFPVFRGNRGKRVSGAYVEKNQPFIYRSLPDKNVWLYYRIDGETLYRAQPMRYLRFGLYMTNLALFYNERVTYYFSEEMPTGSITTREHAVHNDVIYLDERSDEPFFIINNAIIYEQMFKYEQVEKIITGLVKDVKSVRSGLM